MKVLKYLIVFIHFLRSAWHWEIKRVAVKGEGSQRGIWLAGALQHGKRYASSLRSFSVPKVRWVINQLTIHTHNGGASQWSADGQQIGAFLCALLIFSQSSCNEYKESRCTAKNVFLTIRPHRHHAKWILFQICYHLWGWMSQTNTITVNLTHNIPSMIISAFHK